MIRHVMRILTWTAAAAGLVCAPLSGYAAMAVLLHNGKTAIVGLVYGYVIYAFGLCIVTLALKATRRPDAWPIAVRVCGMASLAAAVLIMSVPGIS